MLLEHLDRHGTAENEVDAVSLTLSVVALTQQESVYCASPVGKKREEGRKVEIGADSCLAREVSYTQGWKKSKLRKPE